MTDYDFTFKIMLLGEKSTQKTSLTIRYISGFFLEDLRLTIGVDFFSKTTTYNGRNIKLQIWDFGGEERFHFLLSQYCKGVSGVMLLYDITNPITLSNLPAWVELIRRHAGDIPIILIGVKLDLEQYRVITREEGINFARAYNLSAFAEISIENGQNVEEVFNLLTELVLGNYSNNSSGLNEGIHEFNEGNAPLLQTENPLNEILRRSPRHPVDEQIPQFRPPPIIRRENSVQKRRIQPQAVFKVNENLVLKLENNRTNIYVNDRLFNQCKYLLLNLSTKDFKQYDNIDSIDEAAEKLDRSLEIGSSKVEIDPQTEFWGHCSNIQAWYENEYDTRILHRNLAFPLLKALVNAGDTLAKKVFKDEIALRLESGYPSVIFYLIENNYLDFLNDDELATVLENLPKWIKHKIRRTLI